MASNFFCKTLKVDRRNEEPIDTLSIRTLLMAAFTEASDKAISNSGDNGSEYHAIATQIDAVIKRCYMASAPSL